MENNVKNLEIDTFVGTGVLIGYNTYTKNNEDFHTYYVLKGKKDRITGLYDKVELAVINQNEQTLEDIKNQLPVEYDLEIDQFGKTVYKRYSNIRSI